MKKQAIGLLALSPLALGACAEVTPQQIAQASAQCSAVGITVQHPSHAHCTEELTVNVHDQLANFEMANIIVGLGLGVAGLLISIGAATAYSN